MMHQTKIESLGITNYRVLQDVVLDDLPRMVVVVGTNGSGKSTLFDIFSFLQDALNRNAAAAVAQRGGFQELVSRGARGPIEFTIKFRESGGRLASYTVQIASENGQVVVNREVLSYRKGQHGWPWRFVDFKKGIGKAIVNESEYGLKGKSEEWEYHELHDPSTLAIKGLGQFKDFRIVSELCSMIEGWYVPRFHVVGAASSIEDWYADRLSSSGGNVAQVAKYLLENHPGRFNQILNVMSRRVPGISSVEAKTTGDGRLVLSFQDKNFNDPFIGRFVSDGTMKMFMYLVLLYAPEPHPLLAVEEPEIQFYPELLQELAEEFRAYAQRGGQVFVSTHSPDFLNGAELEEIFWLEKRGGFSTVKRASDNELLRNLATGALPGYMWSHNMFEGSGISWEE